MNIRNMKPEDYDEVYALWLSCPGMGLNNLDDSREGIARYLAGTLIPVLSLSSRIRSSAQFFPAMADAADISAIPQYLQNISGTEPGGS